MDGLDVQNTRKSNLNWVFILVFILVVFLSIVSLGGITSGVRNNPNSQTNLDIRHILIQRGLLFWLFAFVYIIFGSVLGFIGAIIGDVLRRFVAPSMVFTSGGFFSLLWNRVFWAIGPQVIGMFIGMILGWRLAKSVILLLAPN